MTDIIIQGIGGRMGHVLCEMIAQREDCRVVAGIDMKDGEMNGIPVYDSLTSWTARATSSSTSAPRQLSRRLCPTVRLTSCPSWSAPPAFPRNCS